MCTDNTCACINSSQFKKSTLNMVHDTRRPRHTLLPPCANGWTRLHRHKQLHLRTANTIQASRKRAACLHIRPTCHQHARCQQAPLAALEKQQNVNTHAGLSGATQRQALQAHTHNASPPAGRARPTAPQRKRLNPPPPT